MEENKEFAKAAFEKMFSDLGKHVPCVLDEKPDEHEYKTLSRTMGITMAQVEDLNRLWNVDPKKLVRDAGSNEIVREFVELYIDRLIEAARAGGNVLEYNGFDSIGDGLNRLDGERFVYLTDRLLRKGTDSADFHAPVKPDGEEISMYFNLTGYYGGSPVYRVLTNKDAGIVCNKPDCVRLHFHDCSLTCDEGPDENKHNFVIRLTVEFWVEISDDAPQHCVNLKRPSKDK